MLTAIGAVALAVAAALAPSTAQAAFPGGNGRIAYEWDRSDSLPPAGGILPRIFSVRPDGSDTRQLTFGGPANPDFDPALYSEDRSPSWSADGRRLVFVATTGLGTLRPIAHVTTVDADGGDLTPVVKTRPGPNGDDPSFSPNGRRIITDGLVTFPASGGKPHTIEGFDGRIGFESSPQYSPSGRRIVFYGRRKHREEFSIWSVRRDGSGLRRLTDPGQISSDHFDRAPDYSPDGRQIAFVRGDRTSQAATAIHVMRADGSDERPIPDTEGALDPAYSPAGDRIAVSLPVEAGDEAGCREIFTISPTGADRQRVTESCEVESSFDAFEPARAPSWQPDPPSTFVFGKVKKNKRRGTATLAVGVPGPGGLELAKTGKVKPASERAEAEATVTLPVKPRGKARKQLRRDGRAKVRAEVTYTPDGAGPNTLSKRVKLVMRDR